MCRPMLVLLRVVFASTMFWALLSACGSEKLNQPPTATPAPPVATPSTAPSTELLVFQDQYERLQSAHRAISDIWEALARGEQVQCGDYPTYPAPESIIAPADPELEALAEHLQSAAIAIDDAVNLWRAECGTTRPTAPSAVIDQGRLATRAAGDALREAQLLLPISEL